MTAEPIEQSPVDELHDPNSELRRAARANVATWPPLSGQQLAEIRRLFAGAQLAPRGGAGTPPAAITPRSSAGGPRNTHSHN